MVASDLFTPADRAAISAAVAEAEKKTAGEIVPIVATASDRYERAEDTLGIWLVLIAVTVTWLAIQEIRPATGDWETGWEISLGLVPLLAILVGAWILGTRLAAWVPALKRLAAARRVMRARVEAAAAEAFHLFHARHTRAATGIVIYVSLFERMVCVRADRAISEKVAPEEWKAVCEGLMASIRSGRPVGGFVEAIRRCGDLLAKHFPVQPGDANELTNELRVIDAPGP